MYFEMLCDDCGNELVLDDIKTSELYMTDFKYYVKHEFKIEESSLNPYLVYSCPSCGATFKFSYKECELRIRKAFAHKVLHVRIINMLKNELNKSTIDEASGLSYCGQCFGIGGDGDGYCLNDVIKQCPIRK